MKGWQISVRTTENDAYIVTLEDDFGDSWEYAYVSQNEAASAVIRLMKCSPEEIADWVPDDE